MKTQTFLAAIISLLLAGSALAQNSSIQGEALGNDGRPLANAEVRIQMENAGKPAMIARTDAKGRFSATRLAAGTYKVSVLIGGKLFTTAEHVNAAANRPVRLSLGGKYIPGVAQKKKRWVYIPPSTGSHMDGWHEVGGDTGETRYDVQNVGRVSPESLSRIQRIPFAAPKVGGE